jgi:hypothetical protein
MSKEYDSDSNVDFFTDSKGIVHPIVQKKANKSLAKSTYKSSRHEQNKINQLNLKKEINKKQILLNTLLGEVFTVEEIKHPGLWDDNNQSYVLDEKAQYAQAIANAILFNKRSVQLTSQDLNTYTQSQSLSPDKKRLFEISAKLNLLLNKNTSDGKYRDDARTVAIGIQVIANYNINKDGVLNKEGFKRDLSKMFIDLKFKAQQADWHPSLEFLYGYTVHNFNESPLAAALFARNRIGTYGWRADLQEKGSPVYNQAHHLAAYIISGMDVGKDWTMREAKNQEGNNKSDYILSKIGQKIGSRIKKDLMLPEDIGLSIYNKIKVDH